MTPEQDLEGCHRVLAAAGVAAGALIERVEDVIGERDDAEEALARLREKVETLGAMVPAALRFLSIEPLLEDLGDLDLAGIGWVIVGGESGLNARPMDRRWVRSIRDQCREAAIPFFFKQWGGVQKKRAGRVLDGRMWDELPRPLPPAPLRDDEIRAERGSSAVDELRQVPPGRVQ